MWAESQPGPSRGTPCRQGYCSFCQVLYSDLDQHLSSLRHLNCVQASSKGSNSCSFADSQAKGTLLERFLQDVLLHHPHCYNDPRPSHADLPSISTPLLPREEYDEVCFSGDDNLSLRTREHLPSSNNASTNKDEDPGPCNRSEKRLSEGASQKRPSKKTNKQVEAKTVYLGRKNLTSHQAMPRVHRKAHRKTDRRKTNESLNSPEGPHPSTCPLPLTIPQPWQSWQKERWAAFKEEVFSAPHSDLVDQTIEEVIQNCCHGDTLKSCPLEDTDSFHFSLPHSLQTQSDWDSPVQVDSCVPLIQRQLKDFSHLTDIQVDLTDQVYSHQLELALHNKRCAQKVHRSVPREVPKNLPESLQGKTWSQIEEEDEKRVDDLVRQFRQGHFVCYFDSDSLARYGTKCKSGNEAGHTVEESGIGVFPLLDHDEEEFPRKRDFRMASRCQVVKVSHATQTIRLVVPTVCQQAAEATATSVPTGDRERAEKTPELRCSRLPTSYSPIITPLQSSTSLVYLLCSPTFPPTINTSTTPKRSRKRQRPPDFQKVKALRFLKAPPYPTLCRHVYVNCFGA
ncbi:DBF4-type zinc finger-containing protein 2 isoform X2 [Corythoichthys intestinalis]|uniref:DBF4-type zinc finger-containing protein 2 isoform X2 n=1 Tax=Corythoichthys intestinalis TaxID=161448 RepID=UPI0025A4CF0D|nr:DBF4-type zinc finger-containing protein 2 isoform X2 [Corythoichthys intestinalis]